MGSALESLAEGRGRRLGNGFESRCMARSSSRWGRVGDDAGLDVTLEPAARAF
jgi:hypothetical protein